MTGADSRGEGLAVVSWRTAWRENDYHPWKVSLILDGDIVGSTETVSGFIMADKTVAKSPHETSYY